MEDEEETSDYREIGELLRKAREEKHMAVERAAHKLHIRVRYLSALEEGNLSELPGFPYVKGYLQTYAAFLGLDKEEILRRFERIEGQLSKRGFYLPEVLSQEKKPSYVAIWGGLAAAAALYLIWLAGTYSGHRSVSPVEPFPKPEAKITEPPLDEACFQADSLVYPPCTMMRPEPLDLLPLGPMVSVMELGPITESDELN